MKQVVGGAFSGLFDEAMGNDIIETVIHETSRLKDGLSVAQRGIVLDEILEVVMKSLRPYLTSRIETYIDSITHRLLDPDVELRWHYETNNCQSFCNNLIDHQLFGSLLAPLELPSYDQSKHLNIPMPLYLMSFVCRSGAYVKPKVRSKFDVPNGLTEEYLLKFRYGRHDDSDIIDTLAEYWYDWGAFDGPIYKYQNLFPWDCTEAYNRYPVKCGDCNLAKHAWAFPFDSWSIISLHLARPRQLYSRSATLGPIHTGEGVPGSGMGLMSDKDWFHNRLTVLLAQDNLLTAAAAMARCEQFQEATHWLHNQEDESLDRLKLGGIHRAQPFSHHFEKGRYHQYFAAEWSHLTHPLKVAAYERLRDGRARQRDINAPGEADDSDSGCGGCGGFVCGTVMAACAGACAAGCGGECGSGCVSTCSSGSGDGGGGDGCGGCGGGCGGCGG